MNNYYFTFGSSNEFPYQGGYVAVVAENMKQAIELFRKNYPDHNQGILNCADYYNESHFNNYLSNCNDWSNQSAYWTKFHNVIGVDYYSKPTDEVLDCYVKVVDKALLYTRNQQGIFDVDVLDLLYDKFGSDVLSNIFENSEKLSAPYSLGLLPDRASIINEQFQNKHKEQANKQKEHKDYER